MMIALFPIVWVILTSLKTRVEAPAYPPVWLFHATLDNYLTLFFTTAQAVVTTGAYSIVYTPMKEPYLLYFANSAIVALTVTAVSLSVGAFAAYGFARGRFRFKEGLSTWMLFTRMIPPISIIIPFFVLINDAHLLNTLFALILGHIGLTLPFCVWMLRSFMVEISTDLDDAARVDGCSRVSAFIRVILPLIGPGLAATAILCFMFSYNEFLFALVLTGPSTFTLPVAVGNFDTERGILWGPMCAAATLIMLPVLLFSLIAQKYIVRGLTFGAVK